MRRTLTAAVGLALVSALFVASGCSGSPDTKPAGGDAPSKPAASDGKTTAAGENAQATATPTKTTVTADAKSPAPAGTSGKVQCGMRAPLPARL